MCGIAGYFGAGDTTVLETMTKRIAHRGPDDHGFFVRGEVGFGHRRLSIIDTSSGGHQPMTTPSGRTTIVFNGEIYNFRELKSDLENEGAAFVGGSDTEIILHGYERHGSDYFKKLNGMFAFALYDAEKKTVVLVRDRLGKKPLYWSVSKNTLVFGSELSAVVAHPQVEKKISSAARQMYFALDYVPTPYSIYENVFKLEPGTILTVDALRKIRKEQFWDITFGSGSVPRDFPSVLKSLDEHLASAVRKRLVADVPLGIFLSGGLDSSTVAYYAARASTQKIKTFCVGFDDPSFDERRYAKQVAAQLGTDHYEGTVTAQDALAVIPQLGTLLSEPLADYSFVPTLLLSQFTKQHVTVALGGDGADELFFGYPTFQAERLLSFVPPQAVKALARAARVFAPPSRAHFNLGFKLDRLLAGIESSPAQRHHAWMGTFGTADRSELLVDDTASTSVGQLLENYFSVVASEPRSRQLVYLYLKTYLMDQVLVKVDRASMAKGLEVRAPFLDFEFVDFVNSIDNRYKQRGFTTKFLLKELMRGKLPREIVFRKKHGFGAPVSAWLAGPLKPLVTDLLSGEAIEKQGIFKRSAVEKLMRDHFSGAKDNRKQLWSLVVWQLWSLEALR